MELANSDYLDENYGTDPHQKLHAKHLADKSAEDFLGISSFGVLGQDCHCSWRRRLKGI